MKLVELASILDLDLLSEGVGLDREIKGAYVSDLLSDVIGNSREGHVWITIQVHLNIVAVALLKGLSCIIVVNGRKPDRETLDKATAENVPIFSSQLSAFEIAGRLYGLGLRCR